MPEDLSALSESDLFARYAAILNELKSRGVIRTMNAPAGDYAEYLVATALGGELAKNSEKSFDVLTNNGEKLQVKARVVSDPVRPSQLQLGVFRSFGFDYAVIVLLSAVDYSVVRASKVPRHVMIESAGKHREHVNGNVLFARPDIMGHPDATDLTVTLRAAQTQHKPDDWTDYDPIPMDPFPHPASYYKEQGDAEWCVVDDCDEDATGEVNGLLVCDEHKSDTKGGELTVIELIDGEPYIYTQQPEEGDMRINNTTHEALLEARRTARRDEMKGSPVRLIAERAVKKSQGAFREARKA
jgi:hypothetical protein